MKKNLQILAVLTIVLLSSAITAFAQDSDAAIEYNNQIIGIQSKVDASLVDFITAIESYDIRLMESAKANTLEALKTANKEISALENFDGTEFKKELKVLLKMYKGLTTKELTGVIKLLSKEGDLTDADWEAYDKYFDDALLKYNAGFDRFNAYQDKFAAKWGFAITE